MYRAGLDDNLGLRSVPVAISWWHVTVIQKGLINPAQSFSCHIQGLGILLRESWKPSVGVCAYFCIVPHQNVWVMGRESVKLGRSWVKPQPCHLLNPQGYKLENENMFSDFACVMGTEEGERGRKANLQAILCHRRWYTSSYSLERTLQTRSLWV